MKRYTIGPLQLDVEQRVLYRDTEVVALSPKAFEILLVLVENAGQVISRDSIRERVWGDAFIEDANLSNNISMLRAVLRQHLGDVQPIKTFSKRGYQFTLPVTHESGAHQVAAPTLVEPLVQTEDQPVRTDAMTLLASLAEPGPVRLPRPSVVWKTRENAMLTGLLALGLLVTLAMLRAAHLGTIPQHRPMAALLGGVDRLGNALASIHPIPSLIATLVLFGLATIMAAAGRRRPDLHTGNLLLALSLLIATQLVWTVAPPSPIRNTIGMLGQVLLGLTLAAYRPAKVRFSGWWIFYVDVLPLLAFVICCGLDVRKAAIYVGLSAAGRMMLLGTYVLRRDAVVPILAAVVGWISMALFAAAGQYLAAGFTAIAVTGLYATVNLALRLPAENIGKPILVAGTLLWTLYAATYPVAFLYAPLHLFWSLLLNLSRLLVCLGMAVFILKAQPRQSAQLAVMPRAA